MHFINHPNTDDIQVIRLFDYGTNSERERWYDIDNRLFLLEIIIIYCACMYCSRDRTIVSPYWKSVRVTFQEWTHINISLKLLKWDYSLLLLLLYSKSDGNKLFLMFAWISTSQIYARSDRTTTVFRQFSTDSALTGEKYAWSLSLLTSSAASLGIGYSLLIPSGQLFVIRLLKMTAQ